MTPRCPYENLWYRPGKGESKNGRRNPKRQRVCPEVGLYRKIVICSLGRRNLCCTFQCFRGPSLWTFCSALRGQWPGLGFCLSVLWLGNCSYPGREQCRAGLTSGFSSHKNRSAALSIIQCLKIAACVFCPVFVYGREVSLVLVNPT